MKNPILNSAVLIATGLLMFPVIISFTLMSPTGEDFKIPVIVNQGSKSGGCLSPEYMLNAWYHIERVEKFSDTLDLSGKPGDKKGLYLPQFHEPDNEKAQYSNSGLKIIVDTVNEISIIKKPIWASWLFHRRFDDKKIILQDDTLIQEVQAFAIYIANISDNKYAQVQTQDGSVIMVLEAMNEKGAWKDIEYWSGSWCGNSYFTAAVPPKHYLFTRGIKCSGDLKTKCRLHISNSKKDIYSNVFTMGINQAQFEKPSEK